MLRYIRLLVYHMIEQTNEEKYKCALAMVHYWKQEIYIGALKLTTLSRPHRITNIFVVLLTTRGCMGVIRWISEGGLGEEGALIRWLTKSFARTNNGPSNHVLAQSCLYRKISRWLYIPYKKCVINNNLGSWKLRDCEIFKFNSFKIDFWPRKMLQFKLR